LRGQVRSVLALMRGPCRRPPCPARQVCRPEGEGRAGGPNPGALRKCGLLRLNACCAAHLSACCASAAPLLLGQRLPAAVGDARRAPAWRASRGDVVTARRGAKSVRLCVQNVQSRKLAVPLAAVSRRHSSRWRLAAAAGSRHAALCGHCQRGGGSRAAEVTLAWRRARGRCRGRAACCARRSLPARTGGLG
jgi:hypothetical protein